jgi:hypothetical protein
MKLQALTSALNRDELSLQSVQIVFSIHCVGNWVGPRIGLNVTAKRESFSLSRTEPDPLTLLPEVLRFTLLCLLETSSAVTEETKEGRPEWSNDEKNYEDCYVVLRDAYPNLRLLLHLKPPPHPQKRG